MNSLLQFCAIKIYYLENVAKNKLQVHNLEFSDEINNTMIPQNLLKRNKPQPKPIMRHF